ncbi:sulfite exporter TauE/SafE family protein [Aquamicrobium sp. LC103]|uniref:sulfite exporter TauE/SafE family protein n=1 Tax=Aquamicrobium sp. LC103 TaxID=1120658 RepID=UPI00063EADFB|nr:sulfite exporter TauE/SafE family protein [Aquamicrobium sp. LC103]TKT79156.1 sulfite exporter TauE/SafE family protein [Aquamicrobium sp. LC103]
MVGLDLPWGELASFAFAIAGAGVVAGLLAGIFGIGGGAVLVPVFYQVLGLLGVDESVRMHLSVGSSLAIIIPTSIRSFTAHKARGAVDMELLKSFLIPVPAGVVLASLTAAYISSESLRIIFAVTTLAVAFRLLFNRESWRIGEKIPGNPARGIVGLLIGYFSTLMGIGGGVMNNTFMTLYGRSMHQAVGTSSGVGVLIAIPGTIGYIWAGWGNPLLPIASTGFINWIAVALIIPIALIVTPYGVRIAHALKKRQMEVAFGLFCVFVSARFFWSLIG